MALLLGIDTGGTYTDAALMRSGDDRPHLIAKAKSLTTRHDYAVGIADAARRVIIESGCDPAEIGLVSLSTTLATNALVEGQGNRVALIAIGFERSDLDKAGLAEALGDDPVILLPGGHTTHGAPVKPLDMTELEERIDDLSDQVKGFAIAGYFAVRNPEHENKVRDFLRQRTTCSTTCSHELSARLNGPRRALTTVLNARLVPMITRLIEATRRSLQEQDIDAPLMIVRGDGALVGADSAVHRPIETILSGPAASLVGARFLTGLDDAVINDIGGTTSDVAVLADGQPKIDPDGALVGGYRTMVEAVAMHTFGLGGDSEVSIAGPALEPEISLGPKRLIPIGLLAQQHGEIVHSAMDRQLKSALNGRYDGKFVLLTYSGQTGDLPGGESRLLDRISTTPQPLEGLLQGAAQSTALRRLVEKGLVMISGLTPSDAAHLAMDYCPWDKEACRKALLLFGRQRNGRGNAISDDPVDLAKRIIRRVERRSAEVVLETSLHEQGNSAVDLADSKLITAMLDTQHDRSSQTDDTTSLVSRTGSDKLIDFSLSLGRPLVGLGASAGMYHPNAAAILKTTAYVPDHAEVANAIGAVVGHVIMKAQALISQPGEGRFQVTDIAEPFASEESAIEAATDQCSQRALTLARESGAQDVEISIERDIKRATVESRDMLIEARIIATAHGRPPIAQ